MDVNNAFLNGELEKEVFMKQPSDFVDSSQKHLVCKLEKSLYGLKHAPKAWFVKFKIGLASLGFKETKLDSSLFLRCSGNATMSVLIYVDDVIIIGICSKQTKELVHQFNVLFSIKDLGLVNYFLGIEVIHHSSSVFLSQQKYVKRFVG